MARGKIADYIAKKSRPIIIGEEGNIANRAARRINKGVEDAMGYTAKGVGKAAFRKTDQTFYNGYTGLAPTPLLTAAAWGGAAAYAGVGSIRAVNEPVTGPVESQVGAHAMNGDGMGTNRTDHSMGASGSMVFGLNAMRRG